MKSIKEAFKTKFNKYKIRYIADANYPSIYLIDDDNGFDFSSLQGISIDNLKEPIILISYIAPDKWVIITEEVLSFKNVVLSKTINLDRITGVKSLLEYPKLSDINRIKIISESDEYIVETDKNGAANFLEELIRVAFQKANARKKDISDKRNL